MAVLIKAHTDESVNVSPKNGKTFSLKELQEYVGGLIEILYLPEHRLLIINDEGKLLGLEMNVIASAIYGRLDDFIVGDAIYCSDEEVE